MSTVSGPVNEHVVLGIDKTINSYSPLGLYPCDRKTCFGPAGSHAIYRSREKDYTKIGRSEKKNEQLHPSLFEHMFHTQTAKVSARESQEDRTSKSASLSKFSKSIPTTRAASPLQQRPGLSSKPENKSKGHSGYTVWGNNHLLVNGSMLGPRGSVDSRSILRGLSPLQHMEKHGKITSKQETLIHQIFQN